MTGRAKQPDRLRALEQQVAQLTAQMAQLQRRPSQVAHRDPVFWARTIAPYGESYPGSSNNKLPIVPIDREWTKEVGEETATDTAQRTRPTGISYGDSHVAEGERVLCFRHEASQQTYRFPTYVPEVRELYTPTMIRTVSPSSGGGSGTLANNEVKGTIGAAFHWRDRIGELEDIGVVYTLGASAPDPTAAGLAHYTIDGGGLYRVHFQWQVYRGNDDDWSSSTITDEVTATTGDNTNQINVDVHTHDYERPHQVLRTTAWAYWLYRVGGSGSWSAAPFRYSLKTIVTVPLHQNDADFAFSGSATWLLNLPAETELRLMAGAFPASWSGSPNSFVVLENGTRMVWEKLGPALPVSDSMWGVSATLSRYPAASSTYP